MKIRLTAVCALLAILVLTGAGLAAEYIVDAQAPGAADTNAGTEAAPWKTLQQAASYRQRKGLTATRPK